MDLVLYPIHLGTHWCLAAVNNNQHTISYYDSLGGHGMSCLAALREYLMAEHRDKKKAELSLERWRDISPEVRWRLPLECHVYTSFSPLGSGHPHTEEWLRLRSLHMHGEVPTAASLLTFIVLLHSHSMPVTWPAMPPSLSRRCVYKLVLMK